MRTKKMKWKRKNKATGQTRELLGCTASQSRCPICHEVEHATNASREVSGPERPSRAKSGRTPAPLGLETSLAPPAGRRPRRSFAPCPPCSRSCHQTAGRGGATSRVPPPHVGREIETEGEVDDQGQGVPHNFSSRTEKSKNIEGT